MHHRIARTLRSQHPAGKLVAILLTLCMIALSTSVQLQLFFFCQSLWILVALYASTPQTLMRGIFSILVIQSLYGISYIFSMSSSLISSPILFKISVCTITEESLHRTLSLVLRLCNALLYSWVLSNIISSYELLFVLTRYLRVPAMFAYPISVSLSLISMFQQDFAQMRKAYMLKHGSWFRIIRHPYRAYQDLAIPLLLRSLLQAERTVLSMESRGIGSTPKRTFMDAPRFRSSDLFVIVFIILQLTVATIFPRALASKSCDAPSRLGTLLA